MNVAPANLLPTLDSRSKDFLCGIEFYEEIYIPDDTNGFIPSDAIARFATAKVNFAYQLTASITTGALYHREVFSMPSLTRNIGKQSNNLSVRFSNVTKRFATFLLNNQVEGMRMVVRVLSRQFLSNPGTGEGPEMRSFVAFVGRCQRPSGFDRSSGSIEVRQDLGQVEARIAPHIFQKSCPLRFGGTECLGTELLTDKNAAFQTAFATSGERGCNKTFIACDLFANTEFFQGLRVFQIPGSFIYKAHQGFFAKLFHIASFGLFFKRRVVTVDTSLEDLTPYGQTIPTVFGRWQMTGIPLQYQDTGINIFFLMAWCRGRIAAILNIRNNTPGFSQPGSIINHYGDYGGAADQLADTVFPEHDFFSRLAYTTGGCTGSQIDVQDAAPNISAMIAGFSSDVYSGGPNSGTGRIPHSDAAPGYTGLFSFWTTNPAELARYILIDGGFLNLGTTGVEGWRTAITSTYCNGAIRDETNGERLLLPNTESGKAGVDYHRYNSVGLVVPASWGVGNNQFPRSVADHEATYEFYDPDSPPTPSSITVKTVYRKRYTSTIAITDQKKAVDFLYDTLLPTFRGFLTWNNKGQVAVRAERPADSVLLRANSSIGATTIQVDDVTPWLADSNGSYKEEDSPLVVNPLIGQVLIGVGAIPSPIHSEVREVTATAYTSAGNSVTIAISTTGSAAGTVSGATFSGGSSGAPATASVTITNPGVAGDQITVTIDGNASTYTVQTGETVESAAGAVAFALNANPTIKRYIEAQWFTNQDNFSLFVKMGVLTIFPALEFAHSSADEVIRVMMSFAGKASTQANTTRANILDGSFKYLGANGETRYNQWKGTFHDPLRDFAEQPLVVNDYDHQDDITAIKTLDIDLSAVDCYNQASRLLNGAAVKYGDGINFFTWRSNGLALQLEEGDVVCLTDDSGDWINVPVRIEQVQWNENFECSFTARIYSTSMFNDAVDQTDIPLSSGLVNFAAAPPDIAFNTTDFPPDGLVQSTDGSAGITSIRGGAIFGDSIYAQFAYVRLIKRAGVMVNEQVSIIHPDSNNEAVFEFIASADGLYTVELEVCNQWTCNSTKPTADIIIGFGSLFGIATEAGNLLTTEAGNILEREH